MWELHAFHVLVNSIFICVTMNTSGVWAGSFCLLLVVVFRGLFKFAWLASCFVFVFFGSVHVLQSS